MSSKKRVAYMHTIEGLPAYFSEHDGQIVYADHGRSHRAATLAKSVRQVHREQQTTIGNRHKWRMDVDPKHYGYVRVEVPEASQ